MRKEIIFRLIYFFISHVLLIFIYLSELLRKGLRLAKYFALYKWYYLNDELFYFVNHPLEKRPKSIVIISNTELTKEETQKIYNYTAINYIPSLTFVQKQEKQIRHLDSVKNIKVEWVKPGACISELINLSKSGIEVEKKMIVEPSSQLLMYIGKRGMSLPGVPVRFIYSSEMHYLQGIDPVSFFEVLESFSNSEQRNGR